MLKKLGSWARQWEGKLTEDLVLKPGEFGLGKVPGRLKPDSITNMVCGFCSTGCGLNIHLKDGTAINLSPNTHYPVNLGMACPKGWEALTPLQAPDRATDPLLRNTAGELAPVGWDEALKTFVTRFKGIQAQHGNNSVAWLGTGQIVTEELAFLGALGKFGMNLLHGDGNTRQCMATAVVAYKQSFGFDAPPYTYQDFEESDVIVLVGSNLCIAHPIMWQRICRNKNKPEIVVIDPRKTETAMAATQHYPILPKSDLTFFYGLAHLLIKHGRINKAFIEASCTGFDEFSRHVEDFTPERVSQVSGISVRDLQKLALTLHRGQRVSYWWTMGVNQSYEGVRVAQAIINLALMTGNIGRPGTGANSITGQCNAMGSRLFSNTTNLLGGHDFTNAIDREKIAGILGINVANIPDTNSWAYDQIIDGIKQDKIKGLWVVATNSAHSWIDQNDFSRLIKKLDFFVVQDMYHSTETAQLADLVLPAAGWGEKEGTFINSERRFGVCKKVCRAPGQALADFYIFKLVAEYWGCGEMFKKWTSPEAVFQILKELSKGQPCDITGIRDYQTIDHAGGIQWPLKSGELLKSSERRLFEDGKYFHTDQRARFIFETPAAPAEATDAEFPYLLLTGRGTSSQWHTQTRTGKSDVLKKLCPQSVYVEINPEDAEKLQIMSHQKVRVESRRGSLTANAFLTTVVARGQVFIPMHYATSNKLTHPSFDPYSRQPSYKACAVKISAIGMEMRGHKE